MQNTQIGLQQLMVYITIINVVLGLLFGLFPLLSGIKLNNRKYGVIGFAAAIIGGGILGVFLSFPIAFVFTWLIMKNIPVPESSEIAQVKEIPVESRINETENI